MFFVRLYIRFSVFAGAERVRAYGADSYAEASVKPALTRLAAKKGVREGQFRDTFFGVVSFVLCVLPSFSKVEVKWRG